MNSSGTAHIHLFPKKILAAFFIIAVVTCAGLIVVADIFTLRDVRVEGAMDIRGIEKYVGTSAFLVSPDQISHELKSQNPKIQDIAITKTYPGTLHIIVTLKRASVQVKLADGYIIVAPDGYILSKTKDKPDQSVPLIQYYQPLFYNQYKVGTLLENSDIRSTSSISRSIQALGIKVASIDIASENMIVLHTEKFDVFTTSEKDIEQQFLEFEYTYKQLSKEGTEYSSIDVRFEKPIIKLL